MHNDKQYNYHIPINPIEGSDETQTIAILQIHGTAPGRLVLMTKWLKHEFAMTRKQAHQAIIAMGFTDLFHAPSKVH